MDCSVVLAALAALAAVAGCGARSDLEMRDAGSARTERDAARDAPRDAPVELACERVLEVGLTPTHRAQLAVWVEAPGGRFATAALTDAVARRGIGNRPGALQMNSGFRWPYGRRESVLPGWAGARLRSGGAPFRRVIFRDRTSEGFAERTSAEPDTPDDYFCLSFRPDLSRRDGLDAVSCASAFHGDKGRYVTDADVAAGYAEPFETAPGVGSMRALEATSPYPPRRDVVPTGSDHPDVGRYAADALRAMPELDAITIATPRGGAPTTIAWVFPPDWPPGPATVRVEVSTEGDHSVSFDPTSFPTPVAPAGAWDFWAQSFGYPYRGQPSVVFEVEIWVPPTDEPAITVPEHAAVPSWMGASDGSIGMEPIDSRIVDRPDTFPGSGADRLALGPSGARVTAIARSRCTPR